MPLPARPLLQLALLAAAGFASSAHADAEYDAALAACKAVPKSGTRYVAVTGAFMRPVPRADGGLVARIPIAEPVKIECERDGWVRASAEQPSPSVGWIRADLLQAKPPTLASLNADYAAAAPDQRKTVAERIVALTPYQARGHQLLIDALTASGDAEGARKAAAIRDRLLDPKPERLSGEPKLLFVIDRGYAAPIARIGDDGRYQEAGDSARYFPPLRGLHYFRNGGADGVAQVLDQPLSDVSGEALVRIAPATARSDDARGLAANFPATAAKPAVAAVPAAARKAAEEALRAGLRQQKVERAQIERALKAKPDHERDLGLEIHSFEAGGAGPVTVATVIWNLPPAGPDMSDTSVAATAIVEGDGKGGYRVVGSQNASNAGDGLETPRFFDRLDLDGDSVPELIFQVGQYEGVSYQIWTRKSGQWKSVYQGGYVGV
ncbi:hypothetical protein J5226_24600 [Lysobacter sp. K5869]|uniref:hypothetical protein n=1 Tax=Lysobacter sp. K5869 TaxID=2820808 RepID=UPI001C062917|nr:hypothetical protein [Lysobacter sp. K5869]QWP76715.1 hypothetical protein J5226_24600 [Lysobacter sp. K5869]